MINLPPGWKQVRLDEIAEVRLGRQRSPKNHTGTHMRPYLRAANVDWNGLALEDVKTMNFTDKEAEIYRLLPGDIVLSEASGSADHVGKPAIWNGEIEDCCFQNTLIRVRSKGPEPKYLLYFLRYEGLRGAFIGDARGVGIHHLGSKRLAEWPILLPPLAEQRRIVATLEEQLSRLDAAHKSLRKAKFQTPFLTTALNTAAAEGRIHNQDLRSGPGDLKEYFDQERREIWHSTFGDKKYKNPSPANLEICPTAPPGWEIFSLEEVTDPTRVIRYGILMPKVKHDGVIPYIEVKDLAGETLNGKELHRTSIELDAKFSGARIRFGDVVLAVRGSYERSAVVPKNLDNSNISRDVARISPLSGLRAQYLQIYLQSSFTKEYLRRHARGVAVKGVNISAIRSLPIAVPPLETQDVIIEITKERRSGIIRVTEDIERAMTQGELLRQALMRSAFKGRLTEQDDADEPVPMLLENPQGNSMEISQEKATLF